MHETTKTIVSDRVIRMNKIRNHLQFKQFFDGNASVISAFADEHEPDGLCAARDSVIVSSLFIVFFLVWCTQRVKKRFFLILTEQKWARKERGCQMMKKVEEKFRKGMRWWRRWYTAEASHPTVVRSVSHQFFKLSVSDRR